VTDRGPAADPGLACPFVAFEDDRDSRSTRPDHRHRCFAELRPAPRAMAHQEAYCLSAGFAACPTFLDWARREAARAQDAPPAVIGRDAPSPATGAGAAGIAAAGLASAPEVGPSEGPGAAGQDIWAGGSGQRGREWASPPPWSSETASPNAAGSDLPEDGAPDELGEPSAPPPAFLADLDQPSGPSAGAAAAAGASAASASRSRPPRPPVDLDDELEAGSTSGAGDDDAWDRPPTRTGAPPPAATRRRPPADPEAPSWERPRRFEAYPTLRTRRGMSGVSPILLGIGGLAIAALALFFLPSFLLGLGGGSSNATPTPSSSAGDASPSAGASATIDASPTPLVYVVKSGDTMSKIAKANGVTLDELIAANKDTVKDPNKLQIGQEIIIPTSPPAASPAASPESPSPSP
jgi:nucleoid-associated protein YgaU